MKIKPNRDLWIGESSVIAGTRDEIPGVPLTDDHMIVRIGYGHQELKTLHIYSTDKYWRDGDRNALCGRYLSEFQEINTLFATSGCGENETESTHLICNKCIKACKEST